MDSEFTLIIIVLASLIFCSRRLLRYLRFLQQEEYKPGRFLAWVWRKKAFDRRGTIVALFAGLVSVFAIELWHVEAAAIIAAVYLALSVLREEDPRRTGKIVLKMTERAKRIYHTALLFCALVLVIAALTLAIRAPEQMFIWVWFMQVVFFQCLPLFLAFSVLALQPGENAIQQALRREAEAILRSVDPYVIGITGSYGKTSTKNCLGRLLNVCLAPTFFPRGGINTVMGITREIREQLKPEHKYAVIEMGAYRMGSIKRLCDFTPPQAAIVTAVGLMHLERFGGVKNIYLAKSELAQAVPADGILVCNGDDEGARRMAAENPKAKTLLYGINRDLGPLDTWLDDIKVAVEGTSFNLHWQDAVFPVFVPLHGRPVLSNLLAAFTMACALGADAQYVAGAIRNIEPVSNRLEVRKYDGYVQINDAYNANPVGFSAALEVLEQLPGERKILVTPGMIELGAQQESENEKAGQLAARVCELVFVVGTVNQEPLCRGLERGGMAKENIRCFAHRDLALSELNAGRKKGDVILLENDLPDLFEMELRW